MGEKAWPAPSLANQKQARETRAKSEEPELEIFAACNIEFLGEKG